MIKFAVQSEEAGLVLGFGLTAGNIERLRAGQPIRVKLEDLNLPKGRILIFFGETEADVLKIIKPFIGPETEIIGDPPREGKK